MPSPPGCPPWQALLSPHTPVASDPSRAAVSPRRLQPPSTHPCDSRSAAGFCTGHTPLATDPSCPGPTPAASQQQSPPHQGGPRLFIIKASWALVPTEPRAAAEGRIRPCGTVRRGLCPSSISCPLQGAMHSLVLGKPSPSPGRLQTPAPSLPAEIVSSGLESAFGLY